jgi:glycosyltransferase involved in cell wall biosynthesis
VLYFHPSASSEQLAGILDAALKEQPLRAHLARLARARARKFTWDRTAAAIAAVIKELVV